MANPYFLTAADVREIAAERGFSAAEEAVIQAETQCDVSEARAELNRLFNQQSAASAAEMDADIAGLDASDLDDPR